MLRLNNDNNYNKKYIANNSTYNNNHNIVKIIHVRTIYTRFNTLFGLSPVFNMVHIQNKKNCDEKDNKIPERNKKYVQNISLCKIHSRVECG